MEPQSASITTAGGAISAARAGRHAHGAHGISIRELARQSGVSAAQISRIESGAVARPRPEILVALARALNRNPLPLLVLADQLPPEEARRELGSLFGERSELPQALDGCTSFGHMGQLQYELWNTSEDDPDVLKRIAAEVFLAVGAAESMWDDVDALTGQRGQDAKDLREVIRIWRGLGSERGVRWLATGRDFVRAEQQEHLDALDAE